MRSSTRAERRQHERRHRAAAREQLPTRRAAPATGSEVASSGRARRLSRRCHCEAPGRPSQCPLVEAVGEEAEERHHQHDGEHRVVDAAVAEEADQVAEPRCARRSARRTPAARTRARARCGCRSASSGSALGTTTSHSTRNRLGAEAARRPDERLLARARAVIGAERHRQHAAEEDEQDLRAVAETRATARSPGSAPTSASGRALPPADPATLRRGRHHAMSDAEHGTDDDGEREARRAAPQRRRAVRPELAVRASSRHPALATSRKRRQQSRETSPSWTTRLPEQRQQEEQRRSD